MDLFSTISKLFDPYERQARLYPGLLAVAPIAVVFVCFAGADNVLWRTVLSVLVVCGATYALGRIARDAGKRVQDELFVRWGGAPTTQIMRHRDVTIDVHTKLRYHEVLGKGVGKPMPTPATEAADPQSADEHYRAAATWLISQTRDTKVFPLIYKENIAFGFQRNALGLRRVGIGIGILSIVGSLLRLALLTNAVGPTAAAVDRIGPAELAALLVPILFMVFWVYGVNEAALKRTAFAYALRLLEASDRLAQKKRTTRKTGGSTPE